MVNQKAPNQIPIPWMIPIGNMIAPAIRNPQDSSDKQLIIWVNQAATIIARSASPIRTPASDEPFCLSYILYPLSFKFGFDGLTIFLLVHIRK